jgi:UDP-2,3-diacylglucosamine pyrophosphatase LpxH
MARHLIRAAPTRVAMTVGEGARAGSKLETSRKAYGDMGLVPRAVGSLLVREDADVLICGHVHWGQRFRLDVAGRERELVVLSSWEKRGSFARIVDGRIDFRWFD